MRQPADKSGVKLQFVALAIPALLASTMYGRTFYVAVDVTAPEFVKDSISTEITQALRRFPDVAVVNSDELYRVGVVCLDVEKGVQLACSLDLTVSHDYGFYKTYVKPGDEAAWNALMQMMRADRTKVLQQVYVVGVTRFEWFGRDIADTLNSQFLEGLRQLDTTLERGAKSTSGSR